MSKITYFGYRLFFKTSDSYARRKASRLLERELQEGEVVYHLNGNKLDNRPENIMVVPKGVEEKLQHLKIKITYFCL